MIDTKDANRENFESWWLKDQAKSWSRSHDGDTNPHPEWGTAFKPYMWKAWQGCQEARPSNRKDAQPAEPQIDGYPLWSGLPPPAERVALRDVDIFSIAAKNGIGWGMAERGNVIPYFGDEDIAQDYLDFARAILTAQASAQSTDAENVSKNAGEIDRFPPLGSQWLHTNGSTYTVMHCANRDSDRPDYPPIVVYHNTHGKIYAKPLATWYRSRTLVDAPITQSLIAEAARDDVAKMDIDESREYIVKFMRDNFTDRTFSAYIRSDLAGDFAYQMANAIAAVKRDDVAGDAARLSAMLAVLPLAYFCAAFDVPPPHDNVPRDFSVWAKSVIDAYITASTKKVD